MATIHTNPNPADAVSEGPAARFERDLGSIINGFDGTHQDLAGVPASDGEADFASRQSNTVQADGYRKDLQFPTFSTFETAEQLNGYPVKDYTVPGHPSVNKNIPSGRVTRGLALQDDGRQEREYVTNTPHADVPDNTANYGSAQPYVAGDSEASIYATATSPAKTLGDTLD